MAISVSTATGPGRIGTSRLIPRRLPLSQRLGGATDADGMTVGLRTSAGAVRTETHTARDGRMLDI